MRSRPISAAAAALVVVAAGATPAFAGFGATAAPQSQTISSGTLSAPTGLSGSCASLPRRVNLTWTQSSSSFADGYEVLRATTSGGPYASVGSVSGITTTAYTDATVAALSTYYYVVKAKRYLWRSPASNQATVSTTLCV